MTKTNDVTRNRDQLWRPLANVELNAEDQAHAERARKSNLLRRIDHLGLGCRDAETTRHFYEDILGMPLVLAIVQPDPYRNENVELCHFFFELGSGTHLAFFDHPSALVEDEFRPVTAFMRHIAIEVDSEDIVQDFRQRLAKAGIPNRYTDHDVYHSLYFDDPDGHHLEITFKPESNAEFLGKSRKVVREIFDAWIRKRAGYARLSEGASKSE